MKTYTIQIKFTDGEKMSLPLLAKHNREALKLAGRFIKNSKIFINKIINEDGVTILEQ